MCIYHDISVHREHLSIYKMFSVQALKILPPTTCFGSPYMTPSWITASPWGVKHFYSWSQASYCSFGSGKPTGDHVSFWWVSWRAGGLVCIVKRVDWEDIGGLRNWAIFLIQVLNVCWAAAICRHQWYALGLKTWKSHSPCPPCLQGDREKETDHYNTKK